MGLLCLISYALGLSLDQKRNMSWLSIYGLGLSCLMVWCFAPFLCAVFCFVASWFSLLLSLSFHGFIWLTPSFFALHVRWVCWLTSSLRSFVRLTSVLNTGASRWLSLPSVSRIHPGSSLGLISVRACEARLFAGIVLLRSFRAQPVLRR